MLCVDCGGMCACVVVKNRGVVIIYECTCRAFQHTVRSRVGALIDDDSSFGLTSVWRPRVGVNIHADGLRTFSVPVHSCRVVLIVGCCEHM